ncbi:unannotated protein [freshwater metagenome]|uniref:Unannotated protein n=1 Tax=freshwater metagenome TaxID=449393 RepID=A0A6J7I4R3_9ZZZZ
MVIVGLSAVIGSWKTKPILLPRSLATSVSDEANISMPLKTILPDENLVICVGSNFEIANAVTDLPEPDSPTSPTISPGPM